MGSKLLSLADPRRHFVANIWKSPHIQTQIVRVVYDFLSNKVTKKILEDLIIILQKELPRLVH